MSIATLKRKSLAKYNNSTNNTTFSLNGTLRDMSYIGKSSFLSSCDSLNDSNIIKKSSINNKGKIHMLYRTPKYNTVKPDNNQNNNSQQQYISKKRKQELQLEKDINTNVNNPCYSTNITNNINSSCGITNVPGLQNKKCIHNKLNYNLVAISQNEFVYQLNKNCTENDIAYVPTTLNRAPLPPG
jgi:hypothetical protein